MHNTKNPIQPKQHELEDELNDARAVISVEKEQYSNRYENENFCRDKTNSIPSPQTSFIQFHASGEVSIEILQAIDNQLERKEDRLIENQNNAQEQIQRQNSKLSSATSPEDDATKSHFKRIHHKSTLILFGIAAMFLFCNIPRLAVKIFHIYLHGRSVQKHYNDCFAARQLHAPAGIIIMSKLLEQFIIFLIH